MTIPEVPDNIKKLSQKRIPVLAVGWEELGPIVIETIFYREMFNSFCVVIKAETGLEESILVETNCINGAFIPVTNAGKVLFGYNDVSHKKD